MFSTKLSALQFSCSSPRPERTLSKEELFSEIESEEEEEGDDAVDADASGITSFYEYPTFVGAQRMSSEDNDDEDERKEEKDDMSVRN